MMSKPSRKPSAPWPRCSRIASMAHEKVLFVKRKRRIFCSERCSGGERMRRFQKDSSRYKAKRRKYYLKSRRSQAAPQNA
jgi:hypothetical protein